jgi:hypothetical protein
MHLLSEMSRLRSIDPGYTSLQATYDLRRLRRKQLIERLQHRNRYQLTNLGRRVAVLFTKAYGRLLAPGLAALDPGRATTQRRSAAVISSSSHPNVRPAVRVAGVVA